MFDSLKQFIEGLDEKDFYKYLAGAIIAIVIIMGLILFVNYRSISALKKRTNRLNTNRQAVQEILTTFERVKQQKAAVASILEKDKTFKIVGYLDELIARLGLTPHKTGTMQQSEEPLEHLPEYNEIKIIVPFTDMNMRQLTELLNEIDKNERIYTKELDIVKSPTKPSLDVTLTIATLQARTETEAELGS